MHEKLPRSSYSTAWYSPTSELEHDDVSENITPLVKLCSSSTNRKKDLQKGITKASIIVDGGYRNVIVAVKFK